MKACGWAGRAIPATGCGPASLRRRPIWVLVVRPHRIVWVLDHRRHGRDQGIEGFRRKAADLPENPLT
jgi:hypothetical protein